MESISACVCLIREIRKESERSKNSDLFLPALSTAFFPLARCIQQQMFSSTLHPFAGVALLYVVKMLYLMSVYFVLGILNLRKECVLIESSLLLCTRVCSLFV